MPVAFPVPQVEENGDGWGPSAVPDRLKDVPFAIFQKGDRIGKAADWTQAAYQKYPGRYGTGQQGAAVFNFFASEEEESFHLVDNRPVKTTKFGGQRRFQQNRYQQGGRGGRGGDSRDMQGRLGLDGDKKGGKGGQQGQQKKQQPWQNYGNRDQQRQTNYVSSVEIRPEWAVVEQIPFASLAKLSCNVGEPEDVAKCGELEYYDKAYDRITIKSETPLEKTRRAFRNVTTSEDPVIRKLADAASARVFATDSILTTLMCVRSAIYSWDILITKAGGKLFFDKRDSSNLNLLTVNETAPEPNEEKDSLNAIGPLSFEATSINQNFSQQVLVKNGEKLRFESPNPFASDEEELASCAYRYRKWRINEDDEVDIIVRCELDAAIQVKGEEQLLTVKALNETDLRTQDWRKKIEAQRGALLAFETKNNKNKVAKWTAGALLAGADMIKLGYCSRNGPRDNSNHVILGTQVCKPKEFASQITLNMDHCWGIVRALVDMLLKLEDGKFLLIKDPNKDLLRLYSVPEDAFASNYSDEAAAAAEQKASERTASAAKA
ncbi:hypothetical protein CEUSTIGMA_g762.t1 [Chlamydomonas eustigma]|uniref:Eukaryotic translation initiation factor 3 subunit D n=1 Tax=Chlamydomonas eustigma TaxID=1157962 RepID=A0A250WR60_9CHLO|nr:hypothetical protein CEUSTIGMA_g762.t1 [Chlamydomonas eustigma]|eukprot:GAX73308.1 hypothetical protein CEUSTIGMA_g762.t1 [Chlamydomonas eustigma]